MTKDYFIEMWIDHVVSIHRLDPTFFFSSKMMDVFARMQNIVENGTP
jgi:hypothetical protein